MPPPTKQPILGSAFAVTSTAVGDDEVQLLPVFETLAADKFLVIYMRPMCCAYLRVAEAHASR